MNSVDLLRLYIGGNPLAEYASVTFLVKNRCRAVRKLFDKRPESGAVEPAACKRI